MKNNILYRGKNRIIRGVSVFLVMLLLWLSTASVFAITTKPDLICQSALLVDITSGKVLYEKDADARRHPASTTKMITGILAVEQLDLTRVLTADKDAAAITGSRIALSEGDKISATDALNTLLIASCNDSAILIAKALGGNLAGFADMMNAKLKEIGAESTHFVNPHGLTEANHYTTARDLAKIALYCLQNQEFVDIISKDSYTYTVEGKETRVETASTTNALLADGDYHYDGVYGVKTGNTFAAGTCLVAACKRGETNLLAVVLKSEGDGRFEDATKLLDWGFDNYETVRLNHIDEETIGVKGGAYKSVPIAPSRSYYDTDVIGYVQYDASSTIDKTIKAPFEAGSKVGTLTITKNKEVVDTIDIVTTQAMEKGTFLSVFGIENPTAFKIFHVAKIILIILLVLFLLLIARIIYVYILRQKRKKRRAEMLRKKREPERQNQEQNHY